MAMLKWDATGQRRVEAGISRGVLYPRGKSGVAWNGLTAVHERPSGAEEVGLFADNLKYASFRSSERFEATVEAYIYPEEFSECDGSVTVTDGVKIGQQKRLPFDLCYRTEIFTDTDSIFTDNYKIHLVYNATASPSERNHQTLNDSPDAMEMSWELQCMPFIINGHRAASTIVLDTTKADRIKIEAIEKILYGSPDSNPRMPDPDEVVQLLKRLDLHRVFLDAFSQKGQWIWDTFNFREDTVPIAIDRESERHIYNEPAPGTEYVRPAIAYSLLSEEPNGQRRYMIVVVDTNRNSEYAAYLKTRLDLTNEEITKSGDTYYYSYILYI